MPVSAVQNANSPVYGLISLWCPVVGLVSQRVTDLLQIEAAHVKHQARLDPSSSTSAGGANARPAAVEDVHLDRGDI